MTDIRYATINIEEAGAFKGVRALLIDRGGPNRSAFLIDRSGVRQISAEEVESLDVAFLHRPTHPPFVSPDPSATPEDGISALAEICRFEGGLGDVKVLFGCLVANMVAGEATKVALIFIGDGGAGKTTAATLAANVLDGLESLDGDIRDAEDMLIVAQDSAVVTFDNISAIDRSMANLLCRIVQPNKTSRRGLFTQKRVTFSAHATAIATTTSDGIIIAMKQGKKGADGSIAFETTVAEFFAILKAWGSAMDMDREKFWPRNQISMGRALAGIAPAAAKAGVMISKPRTTGARRIRIEMSPDAMAMATVASLDAGHIFADVANPDPNVF